MLTSITNTKRTSVVGAVVAITPSSVVRGSIVVDLNKGYAHPPNGKFEAAD